MLVSGVISASSSGRSRRHLLAVARVERLAEQVAGRGRERLLVADLGGAGGESPVPDLRRGAVVEERHALAAARSPARPESRTARAGGRRAPGSPGAASRRATAAAARARAPAPTARRPARSHPRAPRAGWRGRPAAARRARRARRPRRTPRWPAPRARRSTAGGGRAPPPRCSLVCKLVAARTRARARAARSGRRGLAANEAGVEQLVELGCDRTAGDRLESRGA